jgi:replicative DNA helicase
MLEKGAFDTVVEILKPECFYVDAHQRIFKSMKSLANKSQPIDILTVVEELRSLEELELIGGPYFVTKLTNAVVSSANIEAHSRIFFKNLFNEKLYV